jgi:DNA polymerase elongation subunit (family B)
MLLGARESPEEFQNLVLSYRDRVLNGVLEIDDVVLSKRLSKAIGGYVRKVKKDGTWAAQPAHVEVARQLKSRGRDVGKGARIEYVVADGTAKPMRCIPAEDFQGELDRYHLWEELVYPATERVLESALPGGPWAALRAVRPVRPRRRRTDALPGQLALFKAS